MKLNTDSFVGVGICIVGLLGVGYAIGVHSRMKAVCDKLDTSIDRLANETEVDIPAKVIDQAVQRAVDRESYSAVKRATDEVVDDVIDTIFPIMVGLPWTAHGVVCSFYLNLCKSDHREGGITFETAKASNFNVNVSQTPVGSVESPAI